MHKRVVVAMSGGVDSSVAAALLKQEGFEVIGVTMCFNLPDAVSKKPRCCGSQGIRDARCLADKLKLKYYVLNLQKVLEEQVIKDFCLEYARGRTPNPCIRCNQYIKFDALLKKAFVLDAEFLATGHYARIVRDQGSELKGQGYLLEKAKDKKKDQSYFLYRLGQEQLKHILFPLSNFTKEQVRKLAKKFNLPVAEKKASQEICFIPGDDYRGFLKMRMGAAIKPGPIVDLKGNLLGEHQGICFYTIGQRQGLGIAGKYPLYITKIDVIKNEITLGRKEDVYRREFLLSQPHFIAGPPEKKIALKVKIRYNHQEAKAIVLPEGTGKIRVFFPKEQFAITPGQSAVFYNQDTVVGGGIIDEVLN